MKRLKYLLLALAAPGVLGQALAQLAPAMTPDMSCLIVPSLEVNVGTPLDGVLEEVTVDRGAMVTVGQVLARLNSGVESANVDYHATKSEFSERKLQRHQEMVQKQLISPHELDEIATERKLAEMELRERREQLKLRTITSPVRGVVVDRYRVKGDLVKQEKIFRIAQLDPLHVELVLPARLFGRFQIGQSYEVTPEMSRTRYSAKVSNVDRVIDAASGTFRVRLQLPNPRYDLPSGLRCSVNFQ